MTKRQDWKKLLKADSTDWLLEKDDPGVRYLALRDLVGADEKEIKAARIQAHRHGPIADILKNMNPEGYWITPGLGYTPKFKSTVWSILSLAQLGASAEEDNRISTACNYLLDHALAKGGQFTARRPTDMGLCLQGNLLSALTELGCKDTRLDTAYEWMARRLTGENLPRKLNADGLGPAHGVPGPFRYLKFITDPMFGCRTNKGLSCGWAGVSVLMAFSKLPVARRTGPINRAIAAGVEFFFIVDPSTADFHDSKSGVPNLKWWQFKFPDFYATDVLKLAEALTALGYGTNPRLTNTLELISEKQDENGRWTLEYIDYVRKMWVNYGEVNQPNKWITLRAMRVLKRAGERHLKFQKSNLKTTNQK
jgi:hypothetical protein